jgi:hypothetical protein
MFLMEGLMERAAFRVEWPADHANKLAARAGIWSALADPDLQDVCVFALIGLLLTLCLASAFPLVDDAITAVALLS